MSTRVDIVPICHGVEETDCGLAVRSEIRSNCCVICMHLLAPEGGNCSSSPSTVPTRPEASAFAKIRESVSLSLDRPVPAVSAVGGRAAEAVSCESPIVGHRPVMEDHGYGVAGGDKGSGVLTVPINHHDRLIGAEDESQVLIAAERFAA